MAIDSAPKRKAVAALSGSHWFGPGVTPDATPDQFWRQTVGYGYPGILAGGDDSGTRRQRALSAFSRRRGKRCR